MTTLIGPLEAGSAVATPSVIEWLDMDIRRCGLALVLLIVTGKGYAECGDVFDQPIPPRDYADPKNHMQSSVTGNAFKSYVDTVESRHFTPQVRNLVRGESGRAIMPDLAYTLGKFPNHYAALWSLIKYDQRLGGKLPAVKERGFTQSVECYFERAIQFKPDDGKVRQLYGTYFHLNKKYLRAVEQYQAAEQSIKSAELFYNIGLLYFELGDLSKSRAYAVKAYELNYPLPGLRQKLLRQGIKI